MLAHDRAAPGVYDPLETVLYYKYCITRLRFGAKALHLSQTLFSIVVYDFVIEADWLRRFD